MSASLRYWPFPSLAPNGVKPQIAVEYRAALVAADGNALAGDVRCREALVRLSARSIISSKKNDPVLVYHLRHHMRPKKR